LPTILLMDGLTGSPAALVRLRDRFAARIADRLPPQSAAIWSARSRVIGP
jgi:hypothetical protein